MTGLGRRLWQTLTERWRWFWGLPPPPGADTPQAIRGRQGEEAAAEFLRRSGWAIVARNWRNGRDELDIVARDGPVLVFCEVRARAAQAVVPGYFSVTARKKRAVARAARAYLRGLAEPPAHFRFDILEVRMSDGAVSDVTHHANVPLFPKHFHAARTADRRPFSHG
jgi:putative endonuclease